MKKIVYLFILLFCLDACKQQTNDKPIVTKIQKNITYLKHGKLCFAALNSNANGYYITSFTCVPCDSIDWNLQDNKIEWEEVK